MKSTYLVAGAAAAFLAVPAFGQTMVGQAHDFSGTGWADGEICKPCHTPHFADTEIGFLWAHTMSTQTYTLYDGTTSSPGGVDELVEDRLHQLTGAAPQHRVGDRIVEPAERRVGGHRDQADVQPLGDQRVALIRYVVGSVDE